MVVSIYLENKLSSAQISLKFGELDLKLSHYTA